MRLVGQAGAGIGLSGRCLLFNRICVRISRTTIGIGRWFVSICHGRNSSALSADGEPVFRGEGMPQMEPTSSGPPGLLASCRFDAIFAHKLAGVFDGGGQAGRGAMALR